MNKNSFAYSKIAKSIRIAVYFILVNLILVSTLVVFASAQVGLYGGVNKYEDSSLFKQNAQVTLNEISLLLIDHNVDYSKYTNDKTNFRFSIYDIDGNYVGGNSTDKYDNFVKAQSRGSEGEWILINIYYGFDQQLTVDDAYKSSYRLFNFLNNSKYYIMVLFAVSCIALVIDVVKICTYTGKKQESGTTSLYWIDKIPFDGLVLISLVVMATLIMAPDNMIRANTLQTIISVTIFEIGATLFITCTASLTRRQRHGSWFKKTIFYQLTTNTAQYLKELSFSFKYVALALLALLAIPVILIKNCDQTAVIIYFVVLTIIACYYISCFKRIKDKTDKLIAGDYESNIKTTDMFGEIRTYSEKLDRLSDGLKEAVEDQMKSERLKIELITNVSHDIKTPLTSIVNYVDLLDKPHSVEDEKEYIEVLKRQTNRLKKLTEDVIEITKASTGNIHADLMDTNANELVSQALGEYQERLSKKNLEVLLNLPSEESEIYVDGNLVWRVLNNCFSNIDKYAKENTRVYIDGFVDEQYYILQIKNISASQLNISAETLMERFVRGERSRNSEGSGLGLNIAKSLIDLQNGRLDIDIDGDLFKVVIKLPLSKKA